MAGGHHSMGERSRRSGSAAGAAQRCRSLRLPRDLRRSTSQRSMKRPGTERIGKLAVARNVAELRRRVRAWRRAGETVALVPTMGALHAGHLALVMRARELCDRVVASLFVNPIQVAPNEDFARYPRDESGDAAKLAAARCDLLYAPPLEEMYPQGFSTSVSVGALADGQCGRFRPGHFAGVTKIDYVDAVEAETLAPLARADRPGRILAAAWLGRTRLIDNVPLQPAG